jgi:pilus assembly protein Flp/PilA
MRKYLQRFVQDQTGVTAIEYGLIAALIAVAIIIVLGVVGTQLNAIFNTVATNLQSAAG